MVAKDTFFYVKKTLNCHGTLLDLSTPCIMGILNLSPDSFYGASIIDIGAASSKPGSLFVTIEKERKLLLPAIHSIVKEFPKAILSVDTYRADIARETVEAGAGLINDISGGALDPAMFEALGALKVPYVLMHMQGVPQTMQEAPKYKDVFKEVFGFMADRIAFLKMYGVTDIIIDPGFGFGKDLAHNYKLLDSLADFQILGHPILAGISRKSMINKVLGTSADKALNGTTVLNTIALLKGASLLRVHDVKEAMEAIKLVEFIKIQ
jgi:dihydropteroate synthase